MVKPTQLPTQASVQLHTEAPLLTVFVTGGTGFLGSHIIYRLLHSQDPDSRYRVRAAARDVDKLRNIFPDEAASGNLQIVHIPNLTTSDYRPHLHGIDALIHCASPIPDDRNSIREIFEAAYNGTIHTVQQAIEVGVKKIIVTGTCATLFSSDWHEAFQPSLTLDQTCYNPISAVDEMAMFLSASDTLAPGDNPESLRQKRMYAYQAAKTLADKKIWELAHAHKDTGVDVTMLLPPDIYGPYIPNYPYPASLASRTGLGTNNHLYYLLTGGPNGPNTFPPIPIGHAIDVRDAAKAHIRALSVDPILDKTVEEIRDKRLIICGSRFTWKQASEIIRNKRPELSSRLPIESEGEGHQPLPQTCVHVDVSLAKEVLGIGRVGEWEYIPFEETVIEAIDVCVEFEKRIS